VVTLAPTLRISSNLEGFVFGEGCVFGAGFCFFAYLILRVLYLVRALCLFLGAQFRGILS
jgi:hypothetical protein